jgi:hypothetical protein
MSRRTAVERLRVAHALRNLPRITEAFAAGRLSYSKVPTVAVPLTGNAEGLIEMHTRARLRIDRTTLTPDWYGERLDPDPILDALLPRRVKTAA